VADSRVPGICRPVFPGGRRRPELCLPSFVCLVWTAVYFLLEQRASLREKGRQAAAAELRAARAEVALRESELERLGQQIEPHFLFNALSAVLACRHDPDAVEVVTSALSDYLRFCLSRGNKPEPLAYELDAVEQLLVVQEARLDEDLHCSVASAPTARQTEVPPLVLAPLVDNALKYAFKTSPAPWKVAITARVGSSPIQRGPDWDLPISAAGSNSTGSTTPSILKPRAGS